MKRSYYSESIDLTGYSRQRDNLREELTLATIEIMPKRSTNSTSDGILAFAERILPRASDLWVQGSLDYKQRLQQLFFPGGNRARPKSIQSNLAAAPLFNYLAPGQSADEEMVSRIFASWNQLDGWLRQFEGLKRVS